MDSMRDTLQQSPAVQQLQQGCARLGLHADVALELVAFLELRRRFALPNDGQEPQGLSPGTQLDQLWHWMLLNTRVARAVHDLIGGEVDHASTDEEDLADDIKVVRRLAALNLLAAKGWTPTLSFWEERGTLLHSLRRITYGPGEVALYVHQGASQELCSTLERLVDHPEIRLSPVGDGGITPWRRPVFAALEDNNTIEPSPPSQVTLVFHLRPEQHQALPHLQDGTSMVAVPCEPHATVGDLYLGAAWYLSPTQEPTQAQLEAAAGQLRLVRGSTSFVDLGSSLLQAGLRQHHVLHVLQQGQELPPGFGVAVRTIAGTVLPLMVHQDMMVLECKQMLEDMEGIPPCQQRLIWDGRQMEDARTLGEYDIPEGGELHLVLRLGGC